MTKPPASRDDDDARAEALFRYRVIAPLLDEREDGALRVRIAARAGERHLHPRHGEIAISGRTLWTWLARFRRGSIDALRPRHRRDRGSLRAAPIAVFERAEALRRELPARWTSTVIDILVREGSLAADAQPHRATLDRHLRRRGASRRQLVVLGAKPTIKMQFDAFGDLWVGDYHHGPKVLAPDGRLTTAKLGAFIDHTTRYPVADRWYLAEDLASLRDTMLRALLVWGPPKLAYTDRGAVYRAEQLAYSLAAIGAHLVHSRPYYSQGRGVIERWWQLADAFQAEIDHRDEPVTIHELNRLWEAFRTLRYLEQPHSDLGMSPAQAIAAVAPTVSAATSSRRSGRFGPTRDACWCSRCAQTSTARSWRARCGPTRGSAPRIDLGPLGSESLRAIIVRISPIVIPKPPHGDHRNRGW